MLSSDLCCIRAGKAICTNIETLPVHTGGNAFTYDQAHTAIGTAKECIVAIESQVPTVLIESS